MRNKTAAILAFSLAAIPSLAADKAPKNTPKTPAADLVWPLPPEQPRVRWIGQVRDLDEVRGKKKNRQSWAARIAGARPAEETGAHMKRPYGITADSRGRIYVADGEERAVYVIDRAAKTVEKRRGTGRAPLALPVGVALDSQDRLFVSDAYLHSITCFDSEGEIVTQFGADKLGRPGGIAIDPRRQKLYVADAKEHRIAVFSIASLRFEKYIGGPSTKGVRESGRFSAPTNLALDSKGNLYVADTWNHRVQVFDPEGRFLRHFGTHGDRPGSFVRPKGIAIDSEDHVYVADAEFNNFQIFTADGKPLLAVGSFGREPGEFVLIAGMYIDRSDRILTTEQDGRIQIFQYLSEASRAGSGEVTQARK